MVVFTKNCLYPANCPELHIRTVLAIFFCVLCLIYAVSYSRVAVLTADSELSSLAETKSSEYRSFLHGIYAYPVVSNRMETWTWLITFLDSIREFPPWLGHHWQNGTTRPTVNSVRFTGAKTIALETSVLEQVNPNTGKARISTVPPYDCDRRCSGPHKRKLLFRGDTVRPVINEDILVLHVRLTDIYDMNRIVSSLFTNATTVLITAVTISQPQAGFDRFEQNFVLPLYDFFHRLYFEHNWLPVSSKRILCSPGAQQLKKVCLLLITWRAWNSSEPLKYIPPAGDGTSEMELQRISSLFNHPRPDACRTLQKVSGYWARSFFDGQYVVCLDSLRAAISANNCLVYSFGILGDWSFDDTMHEAGCEVHSFDPSIHHEDHKRADRHWFHNLGLATNTSEFSSNWSVASYAQIRHRLGHETRVVNVLKMDIEGAEWTFLNDVMHDNTLDFVDQFIVEVHEFGRDSQQQWANTIRQKTLLLHYLEKRGFTLFNKSFHPNGADLRSFKPTSKLIRGKETFFYELAFVKRKKAVNVVWSGRDPYGFPN